MLVQTWQMTHLPVDAEIIIGMSDNGQMLSTFTKNNYNNLLLVMYCGIYLFIYISIYLFIDLKIHLFMYWCM